MSFVVERPGAGWTAVLREQRLSDEPGVRFALLQGLLPLVLAAAGLLRIGAEPTLGVLVLVAGLGCLRLPRATAALSGLVAWAWATGFAGNRFGVLTFSADDLLRLAAAMFAAVLVVILSRYARTRFARHWTGDRTASPR